jgi:hypothetical protein
MPEQEIPVVRWRFHGSEGQHCFARIFGDSRNLGHFNYAWLFTSITLNVDIRLPYVKGLIANLATGGEIQ